MRRLTVPGRRGLRGILKLAGELGAAGTVFSSLATGSVGKVVAESFLVGVDMLVCFYSAAKAQSFAKKTRHLLHGHCWAKLASVQDGGQLARAGQLRRLA